MKKNQCLIKLIKKSINFFASPLLIIRLVLRVIRIMKLYATKTEY